MKRLILLAVFALTFITYCIYITFSHVEVLKTALRPPTPEGYYDYKGITHVHSSLSTGSGSPSDIIRVARENFLDFLIFTDLNVTPPPYELESYYGRTLVLVGAEYSYLDSRLLCYGKADLPAGKGQLQVYLTDLLSQKRTLGADPFFVTLAHPLHPNHPWHGDLPEGLTGIEVINHRSLYEHAWSQNRLAMAFSFLAYPLNPILSYLLFFKAPGDELRVWDELLLKQKTIGFAGADATARAILFGDTALPVPSYEESFAISSNHVLLKSELTGNLQGDRQKILEALAQGQFYMSFDALADPRGFFTEVRGQGQKYPMGSSIKWKRDMKLVVQLPSQPQVPFEVVITKDGFPITTTHDAFTRYDLRFPGVYRVSVRVLVNLPFPFGKKWLPWIYSNPFFIK